MPTPRRHDADAGGPPEVLVADGEIPMTAHDVRLDLLVTADRVISCRGGARRRAGGVRWDELTEEKVDAIPLLRRRRP